MWYLFPIQSLHINYINTNCLVTTLMKSALGTKERFRVLESLFLFFWNLIIGLDLFIFLTKLPPLFFCEWMIELTIKNNLKLVNSNNKFLTNVELNSSRTRHWEGSSKWKKRNKGRVTTNSSNTTVRKNHDDVTIKLCPYQGSTECADRDTLADCSDDLEGHVKYEMLFTRSPLSYCCPS